MSDHKTCWRSEPWYAFDVWADLPNANEVFDLMLNGGEVWMPHRILIDFEDEHAELLLPMVTYADETIGDSTPMHDLHGLWLTTQVPDEEEKNTYLSRGVVDLAFTVAPEPAQTGFDNDWEFIMFQAWQVLPVLEDQFDAAGFAIDPVKQAIKSLVETAEEGLTMHGVLDELRTAAEPILEQIASDRHTWESELFRMGRIHDCAAALATDASYDIYSEELVHT